MKKRQALEDLMPDPKNARAHNERNLATIAASLADVGAGRSIVVDEAGVVLAGNATVEAAKAAGLKLRVVDTDAGTLIAVRRSDLTPEQKTRLAIYDNRAAELATWDSDILLTLQKEGVDLGGMFTADELSELLGVAKPSGRTDPDAVPPPRETDIVPGDLFELGDHRILCGDSTRPADVNRVLAGAEPPLMVTDPPYGIEYDPTWRARAGVNKNVEKMGAVLNDDRADWTEAWKLFPGDACYVWHAGLKSSIVQASLEQAAFTLRAQIVWAKDRLALGRGDYHWQHEPCWYGVRDGKRGRRTKDRSQSTLWRISTPEPWLVDGVPIPETTTLWEIPSREDGGHGHGTQKPVECMARPMRNHKASEVYEPFSGSGSTIIAGQMLGRAVYAIELNPTYVQIAIDRWQQFTGGTATKID